MLRLNLLLLIVAVICALSVVTYDASVNPARVREWLSVHQEIVHSTIEVHVGS